MENCPERAPTGSCSNGPQILTEELIQTLFRNEKGNPNPSPKPYTLKWPPHQGVAVSQSLAIAPFGQTLG